MKISEIIHIAADECLAYDADDYYYKLKDGFSCCAIEEAIYKSGEYKYGGHTKFFDEIKEGLANMGCPVDRADAFEQFGEQCGGSYTNGRIQTEIQGMRYFWLKWAALMAEEQEAANG